MTWSEKTVTSTRIITCVYDITSRLTTSKVGVESTTWYYRFDNNGNLKEMTPNGPNPANGAIRDDAKGWSPGDVQQASWSFSYWKSRRATYWSARKFLETCAEYHLGIKSTY